MASGESPLFPRHASEADLLQNVHTIGDRSNHVILDAIEAVIRSNPAVDSTRCFRLEHAQIMTPSDLERAVRLGGELVELKT